MSFASDKPLVKDTAWLSKPPWAAGIALSLLVVVGCQSTPAPEPTPDLEGAEPQLQNRLHLWWHRRSAQRSSAHYPKRHRRSLGVCTGR